MNVTEKRSLRFMRKQGVPAEHGSLLFLATGPLGLHLIAQFCLQIWVVDLMLNGYDQLFHIP